jgi:methionyl-tRNA formyltransferase
MGARLVAQVLRDAQAQRLRPQRQPTEGVCYASKIEKSEAAIDWSAPAVTIERRARAFDPFPGCHFMHEGEAVKLWRARVHQATGDEHGGGAIKHELGVPRLVAGRVLVDTGEGVLELLTVQRPGGRRITAAAWAAGWGR